MRLIDPSLLIADMVVDARYATTNNFTGKKLYQDATLYLNIHAAAALERAASLLRVNGYRLVLWDAYRPREVQDIMIAKRGTDNYLLQDSNHTKGLAVDVTLADDQGKYLDMGTDFDEFSERGHADAPVSARQQQNRTLLKDAMEQAGFRQWPYEWWHFDYVLQ